jgi:hypothetical protein
VAIKETENDKRPGVLRIGLAGTADRHRQEVRTALADLSDPPLELFECGLDDSSRANGGPPPDVVVVLFDNNNEEHALHYLEQQAELDQRPVLFALIHERSPVLMRRILRAGADRIAFYAARRA